MVHIIVFEFHLGFIDCNISKHKNSPLAVLDECGITFGAADLYTAFSLWHADLLPAGRAFIDVVRLALGHHVFLAGEEAAELVGLIQIPLVLGRTLVDVPGKHAEICVYNAEPGYQRKDKTIPPARDQHDDQACDDREFPKGIHPISSIHKTNQFFLQNNHLPNIFTIIRYCANKSINCQLKIYKVFEAEFPYFI